MEKPPEFNSLDLYKSCLTDSRLWSPYVKEILTRHNLERDGPDLVSGVGGTYPTFIYGDLVVKLFGFFKTFKDSFEIEKNALALISQDNRIKTSGLIEAGFLYSDQWPYLVQSKVEGYSWNDSDLSKKEKLQVAVELAEQINLIHNLTPQDKIGFSVVESQELVSGAKRCVLPPHLVRQVENFTSKHLPEGNVFLHSDITPMHVFVEDGHLKGLIDWGDATTFDRHYELAKLHLNLFECDKELLAAFLKASDWPVENDFSRRALAMAFHRQAIGLTQHFDFDAFHLVAKLFPVNEIATLEELADLLFSV